MNYKDVDVFNQSFRKLLLELRKNMVCTQTDLSKYVGLTRQAISLMESGKRVASFQTFCGLAQGVGLTPGQLMNRFEQICEMEYRAVRLCSDEKSKAEEYVEKMKGKDSVGSD